MSGGATSETIIFIGAILAASALAGAGIAIANDFAQAYEARLDSQAADLSTDIEIINDGRNVPVDPLRIHVRNTGATYVFAEELILIVDGEVATNVTTSSEGFGPGQWLTLTATGLALGPGDHVADVFAGTGGSDRLMFRVAP